MKKIYIAILIIVVNTVYCQNSTTLKADQLYESYQYVDAIKEYQKLAENKNASVYVYEQLGNCYFIIFDNEKALTCFAKAVTGKANPETYYRYAQTLKSFGKYEEANKQMDVFAKLLPNDERAKKHQLNPTYIPSLLNATTMFTVSETNINIKDESDFGAFLTNENELYFVSTRNTLNKKDRWNDQHYLDIFRRLGKNNGILDE
jgi:tetratricopeptide (TPR) repeat protein